VQKQTVSLSKNNKDICNNNGLTLNNTSNRNRRVSTSESSGSSGRTPFEPINRMLFTSTSGFKVNVIINDNYNS
jgi:hypothetical protein